MNGGIGFNGINFGMQIYYWGLLEGAGASFHEMMASDMGVGVRAEGHLINY